jgi:hypothetical protein
MPSRYGMIPQRINHTWALPPEPPTSKAFHPRCVTRITSEEERDR